MRCLVAFLLALGLTGCRRSAGDPLPGLPSVMLWAWERPEDLRFLDSRQTGVAFLAETITVTRGSIAVSPRRHPLLLAPGAKLMAVVRIETAGTAPPSATSSVDAVADRVLDAAALPGVAALQLDYDATLSERPFYRRLAAAIRRRLPPQIPLTMTALVSWCASDTWIVGLPVVDAVPMYFRMGPEPGLRTAALRSPLCQSSTGLSTDELIPVPVRHRVFLFHPRPWTLAAYRAALREVNRWQ